MTTTNEGLAREAGALLMQWVSMWSSPDRDRHHLSRLAGTSLAVAQALGCDDVELCDGPTACHGSQSWCEWCDDVADVCDDDDCHVHHPCAACEKEDASGSRYPEHTCGDDPGYRCSGCGEYLTYGESLSHHAIDRDGNPQPCGPVDKVD